MNLTDFFGIVIGLVVTTTCILAMVLAFDFMSFRRHGRQEKKSLAPTPQLHVFRILSLLDDEDDDTPAEGNGRDDVRLSRYYTDRYLDLVKFGENLAKELISGE